MAQDLELKFAVHEVIAERVVAKVGRLEIEEYEGLHIIKLDGQPLDRITGVNLSWNTASGWQAQFKVFLGER